jgi:UDP-glucose 4-epimerase
VVEALLTAFFKNDRPYSCYNICTGIKTTINQLLDTIQSELPFPVEVEFSGSTPGDQYGVFGNNHLFRNDFGFASKTTLEQGLKETVNAILTLTK